MEELCTQLWGIFNLWVCWVWSPCYSSQNPSLSTLYEAIIQEKAVWLETPDTTPKCNQGSELRFRIDTVHCAMITLQSLFRSEKHKHGKYWTGAGETVEKWPPRLVENQVFQGSCWNDLVVWLCYLVVNQRRRKILWRLPYMYAEKSSQCERTRQNQECRSVWRFTTYIWSHPD